MDCVFDECVYLLYWFVVVVMWCCIGDVELYVVYVDVCIGWLWIVVVCVVEMLLCVDCDWVFVCL